MTEIGSLFQTTIDAHPHDRAAGMDACERLLSAPGLPPEIEEATRRNQTWYLEPIAATGSATFREPPYVTAREVTLPLVPQGWSRFNPSIAADPEGNLAMLVRSSNYTVDGEMRYTINDASGVIRTRNYIVRTIDPKTLAVGDWYPINDLEFHNPEPPFPVVGYEDARLFWYDGWKFSATVRDRSPRGVCQMVMADLEGWDVFDEIILSGQRRHEKNWMPLALGGFPETMRWVISCEPVTWVSMMLPDAVDPVVTFGGEWWPGPWIARAFRGGSQVIALPDRTELALVHEAIDLPGSVPARVYQHRFVAFNQWRMTRISPPFCFHGRGLEFAAGMVLVNDALIISYGRDDASAWLFRLPLERVLGMLKNPLPEDL